MNDETKKTETVGTFTPVPPFGGPVPGPNFGEEINRRMAEATAAIARAAEAEANNLALTARLSAKTEQMEEERRTFEKTLNEIRQTTANMLAEARANYSETVNTLKHVITTSQLSEKNATERLVELQTRVADLRSAADKLQAPKPAIVVRRQADKALDTELAGELANADTKEGGLEVPKTPENTAEG